MLVLIALTALALAGAPATVLSYEVTLRGDTSATLTRDLSLVLRNESAGPVPLPAELNGLAPKEGGPLVAGGAWTPPAGSHTYHFSASGPLDPEVRAGTFDPSFGLPVESARFSIDVPAGVPLSVWSDASATQAEYRPRRIEVAWARVGDDASVVWSAWPNWSTAGRALVDEVRGKLDGRVRMGNAFAGDVDGLGLAGLVDRVRERVALDPGPSSWWTARRAAEVVASGHGTAAERAIVLLSLLQLTGFEALPAGYAPPSPTADPVPLVLPAPDLLPAPLVVVTREGKRVWIDPAAEFTAVPAPPASLDGATVWVPEEVPFRWTDSAGRRSVEIQTTVTLDPSGAVTFRSALSASAAVEEILRERLAGLDELGRASVFEQLLLQARPNLQRLQVHATGLRRADEHLALTIAGAQPAAFDAEPYGLHGTVVPALAVALAGALPPDVEVAETVTLAPPPTVAVAAVAAPPSLLSRVATVERAVDRRDGRAVLRTVVHRYADDPGGILAAEAPAGIEVTLLASAGAPIPRLREAEALSAADRAALEIVALVGNDRPKPAARALRTAWPVTGFGPLVAALSRYVDPSDGRVWSLFAAQEGLTDAHRLALAEALAEGGQAGQALALAEAGEASADPAVGIGSRLLLLELLPGTRGTAEERALLDEAAALGADPRVSAALAQLALRDGDVPGARARLATAQGTALTAMLAIQADAMEGAPQRTVLARVRDLLQGAPPTPSLLLAAAAACGAAEAPREALDHALAAARLAPDDARAWSIVADQALLTGDLRLAADAARRASAERPSDPTLQARAADLTRRLGSAPLAERLSGDPAALFAALEHAGADVEADPDQLMLRAELRLREGLLDAAALDGLTLAARHHRDEGWAYAFAASTGRHYWSLAREGLQIAAARETTARIARMEYRVISGAGDPLEDARALGDDPRARALLTAPRVEAKGPAAPAGFTRRKWLGGQGQVGSTNPATGAAIVWSASDALALPAPLGALWSLHPAPLAEIGLDGRLYQLDGGVMPLFAATAPVRGVERAWAFAFTATDAERALQLALSAR